MKILANDWDIILENEFSKPYYQNLRAFLDNEYQQKIIYPKAKDIYNALRLTEYKNTKVVILGQDPYHEPNQAHGLAFSVNKGTQIPPSLQNIYKELHDDLDCKIPSHGNLEKWAKQGVLLLNTTLTVQAHKANSHQNRGWEIFTDQIIMELNKKQTPLVFILWGNNARSKTKLITNNQHLIIQSAHPSPLSCYRGFFGSKPFSKTNSFLLSTNQQPIDWQIDD